MERNIFVKNGWLAVPLWIGGENIRVAFFAEGKQAYEFRIPYAGDRQPDRYTRLPACVCAWTAEAEEEDFLSYLAGANGLTEPEGKMCVDGSDLPRIHYAPSFGWMNDPNGLLYAKGVYHMFYQYNPFDVRWENMSWGHCVSTDLMHWEERQPVLYPDEAGTMFSGCGLVNERGCFGLPDDALLVFYTAAGGTNDWSKEAAFTQRMAYSLDDGLTFTKWPHVIVDTIGAENRDPKIFYHEMTRSYIMVLWIEGNTFRVLRSADLETWVTSQSLTLEGAWECPDLFPVGDRWYFWSADGFYFCGDFDGYRFETDGVRYEAYLNKAPYAAQTFFRGGDRKERSDELVTVSWLRLPNEGRSFTGVMGLPRQITRGASGIRLSFSPVSQFLERLIPFSYHSGSFRSDVRDVLYITCDSPCDFMVRIGDVTVQMDMAAGRLTVGEETVDVRWIEGACSLLVDRFVLEVSLNYDTMTGAFPLPVTACDSRKVCIPQDGPGAWKVYLFDIDQEESKWRR